MPVDIFARSPRRVNSHDVRNNHVGDGNDEDRPIRSTPARIERRRVRLASDSPVRESSSESDEDGEVNDSDEDSDAPSLVGFPFTGLQHHELDIDSIDGNVSNSGANGNALNPASPLGPEIHSIQFSRYIKDKNTEDKDIHAEIIFGNSFPLFRWV